MKWSSIAVSGDLGSGKSTVTKRLAEHFGWQRHSTGDALREMAKERGMTSLEMNRYAESNPEVDRWIDEETVRLDRAAQGIVFDSRMAWHFAENAFKIHLMVSFEEAALRILGEDRGNVEHYETIEEATQKLRERRASELVRYRKLYGVDVTDLGHYHLCVETSELTPDEVLQGIVAALELPADRRRVVLGQKSCVSRDLPGVVRVDGVFYGAWKPGPLPLLAIDDEDLPGETRTARSAIGENS